MRGHKDFSDFGANRPDDAVGSAYMRAAVSEAVVGAGATATAERAPAVAARPSIESMTDKLYLRYATR